MNEIKRQLNARIGDTSERASRVQRQVNLKINQPHVEKKVHWGHYAVITAFIGILVFCINLIPSTFNGEIGNLTKQPPTTEEDEDGVVLEKGEYYELLKQYFFPDQSEAEFIGGFENGGVKTQTFWLNDHYVQQVISNDGGTVERVYRLNGNQVELVYEGMLEEFDRTQWSLEQLNKLPLKEIILKTPFETGEEYGEWTVIETSGQVTTSYGSFSNVLILERAYDDLRMRKYYVQGFGEVKMESAYLNKDRDEYEIFTSTDFAAISPDPMEDEKSPEYLAKNEGELSLQDSETAFEMCVSALTAYYKAVWNGSDIELATYIGNDNLKQYTQKKIQSQYDLHAHSNDPVQNVEVGDWEVEYTDDRDGGYLYLYLPAQINKTVGGFGESTEFLVRNINGKLVIVDWYTGGKDTYDFMVRGENEMIDNPNVWNDHEWVKNLEQKQSEFSGSTR